MRLHLWAAIVALLLVVAALVYWLGMSSARRDLQDLRDYISTKERMNEADPDFADCGWYDSLLKSCQ